MIKFWKIMMSIFCPTTMLVLGACATTQQAPRCPASNSCEASAQGNSAHSPSVDGLGPQTLKDLAPEIFAAQEQAVQQLAQRLRQQGVEFQIDEHKGVKTVIFMSSGTALINRAAAKYAQTHKGLRLVCEPAVFKGFHGKAMAYGRPQQLKSSMDHLTPIELLISQGSLDHVVVMSEEFALAFDDADPRFEHELDHSIYSDAEANPQIEVTFSPELATAIGQSSASIEEMVVKHGDVIRSIERTRNLPRFPGSIYPKQPQWPVRDSKELVTFLHNDLSWELRESNILSHVFERLVSLSPQQIRMTAESEISSSRVWTILEFPLEVETPQGKTKGIARVYAPKTFASPMLAQKSFQPLLQLALGAQNYSRFGFEVLKMLNQGWRPQVFQPLLKVLSQYPRQEDLYSGNNEHLTDATLTKQVNQILGIQ